MQRRDHSGTRHRHFRYISGAGEEPISMDGTTVGQCLAGALTVIWQGNTRATSDTSDVPGVHPGVTFIMASTGLLCCG